MTPPDANTVPIIHSLTEVYKEGYKISSKISKRDRFGIWAHVENELLNCLSLASEAALETPAQKTSPLKQLRIRLDIVKRLIRLCQELGVLEEKKYFLLQEKLIETSKMAHGWLVYFERKPRP